jgi:2'-hydroxyisoflavone reductase
MQHYGALKYLCEEEAKKAMAGRVLNVRPGLIIGQYDPTDRFTYWINRVSKGGEVLCPGRKDALIQFIHAHDLAKWIIKASEKALVGEYNVTGPDYKLTMEDLLESCKGIISSDANLTWVSEEFLYDNKVQYWSDMPLWIPDRLNIPGFLTADITKALNQDLSFKSLEETILDTLSWAKSRPVDYKFKAGITREKEKELLKLWHLNGH